AGAGVVGPALAWPTHRWPSGKKCGMLKRERRDSGGRRWRARRVVSLIGAVVVSALLLGVLGFGYGTIPALGPALDPGRGAWTSASGGQPVSTERLAVAGLASPATVSFSAQGVASVSAGSTHDMYLALGYVLAKF